ncbi:MAG: Flp family type IVb pilin [Bacillus sp. (in: Bacteria)]|nr:Flp family type IVb pilin [Bacillus sp. (in: firmicutes)]
MMNKLRALFTEEEGQGMTEYGLVLGLIAVGVVAVLITMRESIVALFTKAQAALTSATTGS